MNDVQTPRHPSAISNERGQYLSFKLGNDEYAIEILRVQEILGIRPIVPVPQTPPHVRGVMNLRGAVVPVVDLRGALGLTLEEPGKFSVILVLAVHERTIGFIVDSVSDVLVLGEEVVDRTHGIGSPVASTYVAGIARSQERLVILLDVERIVDAASRSLATAPAALPAPVVVAPPAPPAPVVAAPVETRSAPVVDAQAEAPTSTARELDALCTPASWETSETEPEEPLHAHEALSPDTLA